MLLLVVQVNQVEGQVHSSCRIMVSGAAVPVSFTSAVFGVRWFQLQMGSSTSCSEAGCAKCCCYMPCPVCCRSVAVMLYLSMVCLLAIFTAT